MAQQLVGLEFLKKNEIKDKVCDMGRPFAFISYSHDDYDSQIVMNVFKKLYERGYNLWIDTANMPVDENSWKDSALLALRNKECCKCAIFFRSESSMIKETIATELDTIKALDHIGNIITIDIWKDSDLNADAYYKKILNDGSEGEMKNCNKICEIVKRDNKAIRLKADTENDINALVREIEEELKKHGIEVFPKPEPTESKPTELRQTESEAIEAERQENELSEIVLSDFIKKYDRKSFKRNHFSKLKLVGRGECAEYSTDFYESTSELGWNFIDNILKNRKGEYITFTNQLHPDLQNPVFIDEKDYNERKKNNKTYTYYRELNHMEGQYMYIQFDQYSWIGVFLRSRIMDLNLPLEQFSLVFENFCN